MTEAQIKLKRTESILQELIPEAFSKLSDNRIKELDVIEVRCSKGRSDAKVYLDPSFYDENEKSTILRQLKKARPIIENFCLKDQGWYRCPKLSFEFDEHYQRVNKIEKLFEQIQKEKDK